MSISSRLWIKGRRPAGFTLLEVMIALSIIAIVLVAVLRMQGQTISMNEAFRFYTLAPQLAMARMNEFRMDPQALEFNSSGDFGEAYPNYQWKAAIQEKTLVTPENREMHFKQVNMTVTYQENAYVYTIREYIPAPRENL